MSNNDGKSKNVNQDLGWLEKQFPQLPMELWIKGKSKREWGVGSVEEGRDNSVKLKSCFRTEGALGWRLDRLSRDLPSIFLFFFPYGGTGPDCPMFLSSTLINSEPDLLQGGKLRNCSTAHGREAHHYHHLNSEFQMSKE